MAKETTLKHVKEALEVVYGPFDAITQEEASQWTPPDKPGAGGHRGRYLWTDAFGVVDFLTLYKETSSPKYLELAKSLVRIVHDVLGSTRDASARLPGATEEAPLKGGLRIGKLSATGADGDGQYHHYLTLWMFALNRLALAAGEPRYNDLAIQLAQAIHSRFVLRLESGDLRMVWKISTDMQRVLVPSEGHLDAATGFVVCRVLQRTAKDFMQDNSEGILQKEVEEYEYLMSREGKLSTSTDMLDLGMCLWMCHIFRNETWASNLGAESLGVASMILSRNDGVIARDPGKRLAFREFGTCIGIACFDADMALQSKVEQLIKFWERYIGESTDEDLRPISLVMYAAALNPGGEPSVHVSYLTCDYQYPIPKIWQSLGFRSGYFGPE